MSRSGIYLLAVSVLVACGLAAGSAPASAAQSIGRIRFTWTMPDTYGNVLDLYGLPKPTAPNAVREGPWPVAFKLSDHCDPDVTYNWSVNRIPMQTRRAGSCLFYANPGDFPTQGIYTVEVQTTVGHQDFEGRESIRIEDWLIVSIGDSVASGEGAPERPSWSHAGWQNDRCHRSARAAPALAAWKLAVENPTVSVTFVHLACSGATITEGLIGGYKGLVHSRSAEELPPQVAELKTLAAQRQPNIVLVSIGANDVGFSSIIKRCARRLHVKSCFNKRFGQKASIAQRVADKLALLPDLYARLSTRLSEGTEIPSANVYLTEYFDPTGDLSGETCKRVLRFGGFGLAQADLKDAQDDLLQPLNKRIAKAVEEHGWEEITGIAGAFRQHGYCAKKQRWITTLGESFTHQAGQGLGPSLAGTLHPNPKGYEQIGQLIKTDIEAPLKGSCGTPTKPVAHEIAYSQSRGSAISLPCPSPMPINLPLLPATMLGGMDAPLSILIGLAALALAALILAAFFPPGRVRESAPAVLMTVIGAALIDLSFELQDHTTQSAVLSIAGAFALIAGPALLWRIRTSKQLLIERTNDKDPKAGHNPSADRDPPLSQQDSG